MTITATGLGLQVRDLRNEMSTIWAQPGRLLSYFPRVAAAVNHKHEWLEDAVTPRGITAVSVSEGTVTVSAADKALLQVNMTFNIKDDSAIWKVSALGGAGVNTFTATRVAANGSSTTAIANGKVLEIIGLPLPEGSESGAGDARLRTLGTGYNYTQIFRKEVPITRSAMNTATYGGVDGNLDRQIEMAMWDLSRDINRFLLRGYRQERSATVLGMMGGLYGFATALSVNASSNRLDSYLINDAFQAVVDAGGRPNLILCGLGQGRVMANEYKNHLVVTRGDATRGAFVANVVNEMTGATVQLVTDPDVPDTDAWALDTLGFGISPFTNGDFAEYETTPKGFDGMVRTVLGEITAEFKNANNRCCRIYGLQDSASAIAAIKAEGEVAS